VTTDEDRVLRGVWRDQVIQVGRSRGVEKFEGEIENLIFNTFIYFKPVKRFENSTLIRQLVCYFSYCYHCVAIKAKVLLGIMVTIGSIIIVILQCCQINFFNFRRWTTLATPMYGLQPPNLS